MKKCLALVLVACLQATLATGVLAGPLTLSVDPNPSSLARFVPGEAIGTFQLTLHNDGTVVAPIQAFTINLELSGVGVFFERVNRPGDFNDFGNPASGYVMATHTAGLTSFPPALPVLQGLGTQTLTLADFSINPLDPGAPATDGGFFAEFTLGSTVDASGEAALKLRLGTLSDQSSWGSGEMVEAFGVFNAGPDPTLFGSVVAVPEPSSCVLGLTAIGLLGLVRARRKQ